MKIFDLFVEPANYTLDAIRNVHARFGIDYAFIFGASQASEDVRVSVPVLSKMPRIRRLCYIWRVLKTYDAFIINGYTDKICLTFIFLDILFFRKPYAIDSDTELRIPAHPLKRFVKGLFLKTLFGRNYAYGFAGGRFEHRRLFTHYGMAAERVLINPMVVDNAQYARANVPEPNDVFTFGYLGRLVPVKQVADVVNAVKQLIDKDFKVGLDVVGAGEMRNTLEESARGYSTIRFLGPKFGQEKIDALHRFNALVLYSRYEPWGLVVNEALASGIPCIVSDRVGARNDLIVGADATGLVVPFHDRQALVEAMCRMVKERTAWGRMSRNARNRMEKWGYAQSIACLEKFKEMIGDER